MNKTNLGTYIISDCSDHNAISRYTAAFSREILSPVYCYPTTHPYEAAGLALDIIDELKGKTAVVFVNIAPRKEEVTTEGHKNGRPFLYFFVNSTLVITSSEQEILDFWKTAGLVLSDIKEIDLFSIKKIPSNTQFRSAQCIPIAAKMILRGTYKGKKCFDKLKFQPAKRCIWFIDNFGNCKTNMTEFASDNKLPQIEQLANVKNGEAAQTKGSSGFREKRFIEFTIGGMGNYAKKFDKKLGETF